MLASFSATVLVLWLGLGAGNANNEQPPTVAPQTQMRADLRKDKAIDDLERMGAVRTDPTKGWILVDQATVSWNKPVGQWSQLQLDMAFPPLPPGSDLATVEIEVRLDQGRKAHLVLTRRRKTNVVGQLTLGDVAGAGKQPKVERTFDLPGDLPGGTWKIENRFGLLTVTDPNGKRFISPVSSSSAVIDGWTIRCRRGTIQLRGVEVAAIPRVVPSPEQTKKTEEAKALLRQFKVLYRRGRFAEAGNLAKREVVLRRELRQVSGVAYINCLNNLGVTNRRMGNGLKAEQYYQQAIEVARATLGTHHSITTRAVQNLGTLYVYGKRLADAEKWLQSALALRKEAVGETHSTYLSSLNAYAGVQHAMGHLSQARERYRELGKRYVAVGGGQSLDHAYMLHNLALVETELGEFAAAEQNFMQSLRLREVAVGKKHLDYARCTVGLSNLKSAVGQREEALTLLRSVEKPLANSPDGWKYQRSLGQLFYLLRRYDEAQVAYRAALTQLERRRATAIAEYPEIESNLGSLYRAQGKLGLAIQWHEKAVKSLRGSGNARYLEALRELAKDYYTKGDYRQAESTYKQLLQSYDELGLESTNLRARAMTGQALAQQAMGRYSQAETQFIESHSFLKSRLGEKHQWIAESLLPLVELYIERDQLSKAKALNQKVLSIQATAVGKTHTDYGKSLARMGQICHLLGHFRDAEPFFAQAKSICEDIPADLATVLLDYALFAQARGQSVRAREMLATATDIRRRMLGKSHPLYAAALIHGAILLQDDLQLRQANQVLTEALNIFQQTYGPSSVRCVPVLLRLGRIGLEKSNVDAARRRTMEALACLEGSVVRTKAAYTTAMLQLARCQLHDGDVEQADAAFSRTLRELTESAGQDSTAHAAFLQIYARDCDKQGRFSAAERYLKRAADITLKVSGKDSVRYRDIQERLANALVDRGNIESAERQHLEILQSYEKEFGKEDIFIAKSLNNIARLYLNSGRLDDAEKFAERGRQIREKALGMNHPLYASSLSVLGSIERRRGNMQRSEALIRRVIEIRRNALGTDHPGYAASLLELARIREAVGDAHSATSLISQALQVLADTVGPEHREYASGKVSWGDVCVLQGRYDEAEKAYTQALQIRKRRFGENSSVASALSRLARLDLRRDQVAAARRKYQQCLRIVGDTNGKTHPRYGFYLEDLAECDLAMGRIEEAKSSLRTAIEILEGALGKDNMYTGGLHELLGEAFLLEEKHQESFDALHHSLRLGRRALNDWSLVQSEAQQLWFERALRRRLDKLVSLALRNKAHVLDVYHAALAAKGIVFLQQRNYRLKDDDDKTRSTLRELQVVSSQLAAVMRSTEDQSPDWRKELTELTQRRQELERRLPRRVKGSTEISVNDLFRCLDSKTALVDLLEVRLMQVNRETDVPKLVRERHFVAFVVRSDGSVQLVDLGLASRIQALLKTWLAETRSGTLAGTTATSLRKRLWAPLESRLAGVTTVFVSADGEIGKLPFAALPGRRPGSFLLEDYRLAYAPVPQLLPSILAAPPRRAVPSRLLLMGNVDYGEKPKAADRQRYPKLPGTALETRFIRRMYDRLAADSARVVQLEGAGASEVAFRRQSAGQQMLHLATHGYFRTDIPSIGAAPMDPGWGDSVSVDGFVGYYHPGLMSGLVLAGANHVPTAADDDGLLTALELAYMNLDQVDLAVLSACDTGLGIVAGGEGLLGIQRAFQVSGARSTISSLWRVDDAATCLLMQRFYENLWQKKLGKLDALREAQLWMLNASAETLRVAAASMNRGEVVKLPNAKVIDARVSQGARGRLPPRFWAAFVLSGDWR